MSDSIKNHRNLDDLLRKTFKDDLPPDVERSMRGRFNRFRTMVDETPRIEPWQNFFDLGTRLLLRWLPAKEVLAFSSVLMISMGGFLHISGHRSVMAETLSLVNASLSISGQLLRVTSMECILQIPTEYGHTAEYRIRWLSPERTRVDVRYGDEADKTLWVTASDVAVTDRLTGSFRQYQSVSEVEDPLFEPAWDFLTPEKLSQAIYSKWTPKQYRQPKGEERLTLVYINSEGKTLLEMMVDSGTGLPVSIKKFSANDFNSEEAIEHNMEAHFVWDESISPQFLTPQNQEGSQ